MTFIDIESILDHHHLHLGLMFKGVEENIQEMYNVANAHMIHLCQRYITYFDYYIL